MNRQFVALLFILATTFCCQAEVTIEECIAKSVDNYPAIKKYNLLNSLSEIDLSDINKGWLPKFNVYGQVTGQNVVPSYPDALSDVLEKMGQEVKGLGKVQYKAGVDISQTIWDGGVSKAKREIARIGSNVQQNALDVELYQVRQKVEDIYFAVLLIEKEIELNKINLSILNDNLSRLRAMYRNGVAMQSDIDMVEAQALSVNQKIVQGETAFETYRKLLEIFIGESLENQKLALPSDVMPSDILSCRPELKLFDSKLTFNEANEKLSNTSLNPHIGFFSQLYYGYPGFNYFRSMMDRKPSFNIIGGLKISWNLDSFYTKKSHSERTALNNAEILSDKETFLFNNKLAAESQTGKINGIRKMMKDDSKIVELRTAVRKAAESQLENGVIDITTLLTKINEEHAATLTSKVHEIQLIKEIYNLKYTLGL